MAHLLDSYLRELGLFIMEFAETEKLLLTGLASLSGVSHDLARAIFSGVKSDAARSMIKRVRAVKGMPEDADLTRALDQFGVITATRNMLIHYGPSFTGDWEAEASNAFLAMPGRAESRAATADDLRRMSNDLTVIRGAIVGAILITETQPDVARAMRERVREPWRYKPQ